MSKEKECRTGALVFVKLSAATLTIASLLCLSGCTTNLKSEVNEPYRTINGSFSGEKVAYSPDPLVAYRWSNPQADDSLEIYTIPPVSVTADIPGNINFKNPANLSVKGECNLMFDFGQVNAAWFEFESEDFEGDIEMSISEFNEPAVFNAGAEHPVKTATPAKYGHSYRLELNKELYEGVRFAWIHIKKLDKPASLHNIRLVCQVKPVNYEGSFECSDTMLSRIWYTGAYDVKLNLLHDYFGAILMERSDRISWTGDAHPSQAASLVAFGNYDFIKTNLRHTSTQFNGIVSYSLYWTLSLTDYYSYTGDKALFDEMKDNLCNKLETAYNHYDNLPAMNFYGWDERLGAGFEKPDCAEVQNAYKMLCIRAWNECGKAFFNAGYYDLADKYLMYANEKTASLRAENKSLRTFGVHAAADAINADFLNEKEKDFLWQNTLSDRQQRLSYSPFNQYFIIQSLARLNRYNEALATIDDCWGGQVRYGGTTFFEVFRPSWNDISRPNDAPINNQCGYTSLTHPWSAGVTKWLSEEILGIKPLSPGFKNFIVKPHLSQLVTWVKGKTPTPLGAIAFDYNLETGEGSLTVPDGANAVFAAPLAGKTVSKMFIDGENTDWNDQDADFIYFRDIPAGKHKIKVEYSSGALQPVEKEPFIYELMQAVAEDTVTRGAWIGKYGAKGYLLCNYDDSLVHRVDLPDFISSVNFSKNDDVVWQNSRHVHWTDASDDERALLSPSDSKSRSLGAVTTRDPSPCYQTMTVDIQCKSNRTYRLSLYFVDWERDRRRSAIEVFDLANRKLLMPVTMVRNYENGKYLTFTFDRSVRIRINQVRGMNAALSGIFFN